MKEKKRVYVVELMTLDNTLEIELVVGVYSTWSRAAWARRTFNGIYGVGIQRLEIRSFKLNDLVLTLKVAGL
jgi:hypothetical protein